MFSLMMKIDIIKHNNEVPATNILINCELQDFSGVLDYSIHSLISRIIHLTSFGIAPLQILTQLTK